MLVDISKEFISFLQNMRDFCLGNIPSKGNMPEQKKRPIHCNLYFVIHQLCQSIYWLLFIEEFSLIEDCFSSNEENRFSSVWLILVSYFKHFCFLKLYILASRLHTFSHVQLTKTFQVGTFGLHRFETKMLLLCLTMGNNRGFVHLVQQQATVFTRELHLKWPLKAFKLGLLLCWVWTSGIKTYLAVFKSDRAKHKNRKTICAARSHGMTTRISEDSRYKRNKRKKLEEKITP